MFRVCQTNPLKVKNNQKQHRFASCIQAKARKHTRNEGQDRLHRLDNNFVGFGVSICSALVLLSACTATALTLREAQIETQSIVERYGKLEDKVKMLEDKDVQHEFVINALVNEILKLRDIGFV